MCVCVFFFFFGTELFAEPAGKYVICFDRCNVDVNTR